MDEVFGTYSVGVEAVDRPPFHRSLVRSRPSEQLPYSPSLGLLAAAFEAGSEPGHSVDVASPLVEGRTAAGQRLHSPVGILAELEHRPQRAGKRFGADGPLARLIHDGEIAHPDHERRSDPPIDVVPFEVVDFLLPTINPDALRVTETAVQHAALFVHLPDAPYPAESLGWPAGYERFLISLGPAPKRSP
ncbi:hypothetical protein [Dactylosporangium cerinum]